uniref:Uncharacterized protein n=1 Tax=Pipistrellus kuhlii TaxID=59472 RepID=A0A7J8B1K2_PIPKU|nr:hypothetical protein mPipKuh1_007745 [Pipistrellus kuhlii]
MGVLEGTEKEQEIENCPGQFGSVVGASSCRPKSPSFNSWSRAYTSIVSSTPAPSWGSCGRQLINVHLSHQCLSLSPSLLLSLSTFLSLSLSFFSSSSIPSTLSKYQWTNIYASLGEDYKKKLKLKKKI